MLKNPISASKFQYLIIFVAFVNGGMNCGSSKTAKLQLFDAKSNLFARMIRIRQAIFASKTRKKLNSMKLCCRCKNLKHQLSSNKPYLMLKAFFNRGEVNIKKQTERKYIQFDKIKREYEKEKNEMENRRAHLSIFKSKEKAEISRKIEELELNFQKYENEEEIRNKFINDFERLCKEEKKELDQIEVELKQIK